MQGAERQPSAHRESGDSTRRRPAAPPISDRSVALGRRREYGQHRQGDGGAGDGGARSTPAGHDAAFAERCRRGRAAGAGPSSSSHAGAGPRRSPAGAAVSRCGTTIRRTPTWAPASSPRSSCGAASAEPAYLERARRAARRGPRDAARAVPLRRVGRTSAAGRRAALAPRRREALADAAGRVPPTRSPRRRPRWCEPIEQRDGYLCASEPRTTTTGVTTPTSWRRLHRLAVAARPGARRTAGLREGGPRPVALGARPQPVPGYPMVTPGLGPAGRPACTTSSGARAKPPPPGDAGRRPELAPPRASWRPDAPAKAMLWDNEQALRSGLARRTACGTGEAERPLGRRLHPRGQMGHGLVGRDGARHLLQCQFRPRCRRDAAR